MENLLPINKRLLDTYGRFEDGQANWRVSWTNDQFENRHGTYEDRTDSGVYLRTVTEWRRVPKYAYIPNQYVLERLIPVPENTDINVKTSYEPIWAFGHDLDGKPLPPKYEILVMIISEVHKNLAKTISPEEVPFLETNTPEATKARIDIMEDALFDKSRVGDSLAIGEGVSLSGAYSKKEIH